MSIFYSRPQPSAELTEALGPHVVKVMLCLMRDAYFDLVKKDVIDLTMRENQITEEWYDCLIIRWPRSSLYPTFRPHSQKEDESGKTSSRGNPPTIDFCFRAGWDRLVYFGAECKLIEATNKTLCNEYVENGVCRYIEGKYGAKFPEGAMIGFVRQTPCADVAVELQTRIVALDNASGFDRTNLLAPFEDHYVSKHNRAKGISPFTIHHLLFLFVQTA
ncbi:MAG: hypothetical protein JW901_07975 [Dehalococcoidia bacterium]|nr:hypothetical protein [Dehalococcoidia bacterium]